MKNLSTVFLFMVSLFGSFMHASAQGKNDFNWVLGYGLDTVDSLGFGGNLFSFETGNIAYSFFDIQVFMDSHTMMSDDQGKLLFYTSGCKVMNSQHEEMENGGGLSPGYYYNGYCINNGYSYLVYNGLYSLPDPANPKQYYLFHIRRNLGEEQNDLMFSVINMNYNGGLGKVIQKNNIILSDTLSLVISAVRHANGRDWWLMLAEKYTTVYHTFLVNKTGIYGPFTQVYNTPTWLPAGSEGTYFRFSPDGRWFVRLNELEPSTFHLYRFDRCSGQLGELTLLSLPDMYNYAAWPAFSPSSRYLYVTNQLRRLYQFDLQAADINASRVLIDTFRPSTEPTAPLFGMALAPDGKIYMTSSGTVRFFHVIHQPDKPGKACDFRQHDYHFDARNLIFPPNLPDFRLYNEPNSPCDTLNVTAPVVARFRVDTVGTSSDMERLFQNLSYAQTVSYHWNFGDGLFSSEASPTHTYASAGWYQVCLEACNAAGVCDTECREVAVGTVGTSDMRQDWPLRFFPNPATDKVYLECGVALPGGCRWQLYDVLGAALRTEVLPAGQTIAAFQLSGLAPGLYFWRLEIPGHGGRSGKLQIAR